MNSRRIPPIVLSVLIGLSAGCTVGPDFQKPAGPDVAAYTATSVAAETIASPTPFGAAQHLIPASPADRPQWWKEIGPDSLHALMVAALEANPTLTEAEAVLRQAQELYAAQAGTNLYPQADVGFGSRRQRFSPSASGQDQNAYEFNLHNAGINVHYTFDPAGGTRRELEALAANIDVQRFKLAGARLTLTADIIKTAIARAALAEQLQIGEAILASQQAEVELATERIRLGQAPPDAVLVVQAQAEQTRAGNQAVRNQLQQSEHLLALLGGKPPGTGEIPFISLQEFRLPVDLPLIVPSDLVRIRPDIQAAEAMLQAANARYGVAIAKLYPQLSLSATLGTQALTTEALFGSGSAVWSLVGQLTQPLFQPGLPAEKRAALAAFDAAAANYRSVVLQALRNVADVLRSLENDAQSLNALAAAASAAQQYQGSMQRRYALGAADYSEVLLARQQAQKTRASLMQAEAQRLIDSVTFYQAMGYGDATETDRVAAWR